MKRQTSKGATEGGKIRLDPAIWERLMTAVLLLLAFALDVRPADRTVWYVEMVWCVGLWAILFFTRRKFLFSTSAYFCFFVWMVLQVIGAHFTFEHVPMDWLTKPLGLVRNPYDRIAHFAVGWFAFPLAELFFRRGWMRSPRLAAFFAVASTVALAGIWELVEWIYAVLDGGDAGAAFLGSQGDVWDAQKDILCDTLGALCAAGAFLWRVNRSPSCWTRVAADEPAARRKMVRTKEPLVKTTVEVLLDVIAVSMLFGGVCAAVLALWRYGLSCGWWKGVLLAYAGYELGRVRQTKGFLALLLGVWGWIMILFGLRFALESLFYDGLHSRWWVGVLLVFAGYMLAKRMGMVRKCSLKWWWTYEPCVRRKKQKRGGAKEKADGKT